MKILLNDKEVSNYLASLIDIYEHVSKIKVPETNTSEAVGWTLDRKAKGKGMNPEKVWDKIHKAVEQDTKNYVDSVKSEMSLLRDHYIKNIRTHVEYFINKFGEEFIFEQYKKSKVDYFCKSVGLQIDPDGEFCRRKKYSDVNEDVLIRNTVGNENFLTKKIDSNLPFWFIDSGYTNFLGRHKTWHRLVRNHLHFNKNFEAPVDRLGMFETFPAQWRTGGDKILVIEPGEFAASIFHVEIAQWKRSVEEELRKYTDMKIVFREKAPKKKRAPLYKHLLDEDYYCVVSINSNAATEAIWTGVPVITLDKHISNSVSRNQLSDINNLYRGSLSNWLSMLSYSQFTFDELIDGTAYNIVKKYHV